MSNKARHLVWFPILLIIFSFLDSSVNSVMGAEKFPSRPIELVIPFSAGGSHDAHARAIVSVTPGIIDQPMLVRLMPGGTGAIAAQYVARSKPDGHTLLFGAPDTNTLVNQAQNLPYGKDDFIPIALINYSPTPINVRADAPFDTFEGFVKYAKANPGKIKYASAGVWGIPHVPFEYMQKKLGFKLTHVPYKGGGPALKAILSGETMMSGSQVTQAMQHIRSGKLKMLAIMDTKRHKDFPDVPTTVELGHPDLVFYLWRGVLAPKGTPPEIVTQLEDIFEKVAKDKSFYRMVRRFGEQVLHRRGKGFDEYWTAEYEKMGNLIRELKKK
jgi:tripartite-type tricarboxylate transporter receptor subunit TctC